MEAGEFRYVVHCRLVPPRGVEKCGRFHLLYSTVLQVDAVGPDSSAELLFALRIPPNPACRMAECLPGQARHWRACIGCRSQMGGISINTAWSAKSCQAVQPKSKQIALDRGARPAQPSLSLPCAPRGSAELSTSAQSWRAWRSLKRAAHCVQYHCSCTDRIRDIRTVDRRI